MYRSYYLNRLCDLVAMATNGDVLCFLWSTNWIYICYVEGSRPPLWSSGQSSWLQIQRSVFDFRHYQIFLVMSLEWGPLSLVRTTEKLLGRNSGSGLESREYGSRRSVMLTTWHLYPRKLALTSPTSGCRSVDIVRSHNRAMMFSFS
jgi:hypothetical protein